MENWPNVEQIWRYALITNIDGTMDLIICLIIGKYPNAITGPAMYAKMLHGVLGQLIHSLPRLKWFSVHFEQCLEVAPE